MHEVVQVLLGLLILGLLTRGLLRPSGGTGARVIDHGARSIVLPRPARQDSKRPLVSLRLGPGPIEQYYPGSCEPAEHKEPPVATPGAQIAQPLDLPISGSPFGKGTHGRLHCVAWLGPERRACFAIGQQPSAMRELVKAHDSCGPTRCSTSMSPRSWLSRTLGSGPRLVAEGGSLRATLPGSAIAAARSRKVNRRWSPHR